jgi:hypothetical protein
MLETPSMHQYDNHRDNLCAADNQQGRPAREPSTTTCAAPRKRRKKLGQYRHSGGDGYRYDSTIKRWVRIIRDGQAWCCDCQQWFDLDQFCVINGTKPYQYCKACQRLHKAMSRYSVSREVASRLYSATVCECCGSEFEKQTHKHIHHTQDGVVGVVCITCNHLLRDESPSHIRKLLCCVKWLLSREKI